MGDISNSTRERRFRAVARTVGGLVGALAVAASALAYTLFGASQEAPFLSAGVQPARTADTPTAPSVSSPIEVAPPDPTAVAISAPADPADPPATPLPANEVLSTTPVPSEPVASTVAPVAPSAARPLAVATVSAPAPAAPAAVSAPAPPPATPAPQPATNATPPVTSATPPPPPAVATVALSGREQGLVDAMNARRSAAGVAPLLVSGALTGVARTRSSDMLINNYFAHSSPSGQTWYSLLTGLGLSYSAGGENLARVSGDTAGSVSLAIEALMSSPTHRANILNPAYRMVGVGGAVQGDTVTILTSVFTDR